MHDEKIVFICFAACRSWVSGSIFGAVTEVPGPLSLPKGARGLWPWHVEKPVRAPCPQLPRCLIPPHKQWSKPSSLLEDGGTGPAGGTAPALALRSLAGSGRLLGPGANRQGGGRLAGRAGRGQMWPEARLGGLELPTCGFCWGGWPNSALSPPYMRPYHLPQLQSLPASSRARGNFCNSFLFLSTKACVFSAFLGTSRSFPGKGKLNLSSAGRGNPPCRAVTCSHPPRQTHLVQAPCWLSHRLFLSAAFGLGCFRDSFCSGGAICNFPWVPWSVCCLSPSPLFFPHSLCFPLLQQAFLGRKPFFLFGFVLLCTQQKSAVLLFPTAPRDWWKRILYQLIEIRN